MAPRFTDIGWSKAIKVALGLSALGAVIGAPIGFAIGIVSPEFYSLLLGGSILYPSVVGLFLGLINGSFAGIALGSAFLIACGIAQRGSRTTAENPYSNYPRP